MIMIIQELKSGAIHRRTIKENRSVQYKATNNYIVVSDYYSGAVLHRYNIKKYGSVRFWIE